MKPMKRFFALFAVLSLFLPAMNAAAAPSIYDVSVKNIDDESVKLEQYRGQVLLIVNVASECGYTPQYTGLQATYEKYRAKGLTVLGFPCNQFGGQEPGSNAEIKTFCSAKFHVTFPMFAKIEVNGANRHPLYVMLAGKGAAFPGNIKWNFNKFLIGRDGKILARFDSDVEPDAPELLKAIEGALAAK